MKFKIGDKVKLISYNYGDNKRDPVWCGEFGKVCGIIITIDFYQGGESVISFDRHYPIRVQWKSTNFTTRYKAKDLELINSSPKQLRLF